MNLVFIYGPPATGKLTIGAKLAELTGYRFMHNHLTLDLAREVYPEFDATLFGLVHKIRFDIFEYAAQQGTDLITTFVYDGDDADKAFVQRVVDIITSNGGTVRFVQLTAPSDILLERVSDASRKEFKKIHEPELLKEILETRDGIHDAVDHEQLVVIDTTECTPDESAEIIRRALA